MMSMTCSKHVENYKLNKYIEKNLCIKLDNYQESLHDAGQQNVKSQI